MHCILVWHTYVGILLQLFSLIGETDRWIRWNQYTPLNFIAQGVYWADNSVGEKRQTHRTFPMASPKFHNFM